MICSRTNSYNDSLEIFQCPCHRTRIINYFIRFVTDDPIRRLAPAIRGSKVANLREAPGELVRQNITRTAPGWAGVFRDLLTRAGQARVPLAVVGSAGLAVGGRCPSGRY